MAAGIINLTIEQGATYNHILTWQDSAGDPIDITGYTGRMQIRERKKAGIILVDLTTENGGLTLGDALGTITILIPATETAALEFDLGFYDLELINGATVTRLVEGQATLSKEVTR